MAEEIKRTGADEAEIDFIGIGKRLKGAFFYLLRKWWVLLIALLIGALLGFGFSWWYGKKFVANTAFAVQGQSQTSAMLNSALSLASSLGISGKGGSSGYDNNFFASLIQSRRIVKKSLLEKDVVKGKKDVLAIHFIKEYKWDEKWNEIPQLKNFSFRHYDLQSLTPLEDSMLSVVYNYIIAKNLVVSYDASVPFNKVTFTTTSRDLSKKILKHMIDNTTGYYMSDMYKLNIENLRVAELRLDSLGNALKELDSKVAQMKDNANNIIKQSGLVGLNAAIRDQSLISMQYSAAVNNYELAKTSLLSDAPILDVVDDPVFSTDVKFIPLIFAIIIGGLLVAFMVGAYLFLRFIIIGDVLLKKATKPIN